MIYFTYYQSPVGELGLACNDKGLSCVCRRSGFDEYLDKNSETMRDDDHPRLKQAVGELDEYFAGRRQKFSVPLDPVGTEFQMKAWQALLEIPFGETIHYGEQARRIQRPKASRAVGAANGRNPIAIIVPCHRVIGSNGSLTGYAGGIEMKKSLLELEQAVDLKTYT